MREQPSGPARVSMMAAVVTLMLVAGACAGHEQTPAGAEGGKAPQAAEPRDGDIDFWVREAFRADPRLAPDDITVETEDGIVRLSGTVGNLLEKRYAKLETMKIAGVRGVIDEIGVAPDDRPDAAIREDVLRRLHDSSVIRSPDLSVGVAGGDVTLAGVVHSWTAWKYATMLASEVRGVREVDNGIKVEFPEPQSDEQVRDGIVAAIDRDPYLTGLPIVVRVTGGVATLEGTVGNAYERERAEEVAYGAGTIRRVEDELVVDWSESEGVRDKRPFPTDAQIRQAVRDELREDYRIEFPSRITVQVVGGEVTLAGSVPDFFQDRCAERDARNVVGVISVDSLLTTTTEARDDTAIADDVRLDLQSDYLLNGRSIRVDANEGTVTLSGEVDSPYERSHATEVAARVPGVRDVLDDLVVLPGAGYTDAALEQEIESRLTSDWKTRRSADRIEVRVEDGTATLQGDVDTWSEYLEAGRLAAAVRGVNRVHNDLTVGETERPVAAMHDGGD